MKASRLIAILMLLQSQGQMTAKELAKQLEVSPRTIYRDIDALSEAGIPVYAERGPHGGCALLDDYRTTLTGLNPAEVRALFATALSDLLSPVGLEKDTADAQRKLQAALPPGQRQDVERLRELIYIDPHGWFQPPEPLPFLPLLQEALWTRRQVQLTYRGREGNWSKRMLAPLGLVAKAGAWYVVLDGRDWRMTCRVSRIVEAALSDVGYKIPEGFSLQAYWQSQTAEFERQRRTYGVRLRVPPEGVSPLREILGEGIVHLVMEAEMLDILGTVELDLRFEGLEQAVRILMGAAAAVEILEPLELRQRIHSEASKLLKRYLAKPAGGQNS